LHYEETVDQDEALRRTIVWEQDNPPGTVSPQQFDYAAEDEAAADAGHALFDRYGQRSLY
jgi:hypothetical protein